jgi:multicomponent Na+:H+ antiporter subunit B
VTDAVLAGLLVFVVVTALATALARGLVVTILVFGAYSLGLAMVWVVLRAPDVALTEAAVGAGVTTSLFLLLVRRAARAGDEATRPDDAAARSGAVTPTRRPRPAAVGVAALVTVGLLFTIPSLPPVGAADAPGFGPVTDFYVTDAADRGIDNAVTAVLVVYRGFDTFGEIIVVLAAAVAVLAVFGREVVA